LSASAVGGSVYSVESLERVRKLLPVAGFPSQAPLATMAEEDHLRAGRQVLLTRCVACHDLKTILTSPRPPVGWVRTVERMANKPVFGHPIDPEDQWAVASYLIAISPDLQVSAKRRREQELQSASAKDALLSAIGETAAGGGAGYDAGRAQDLFEETCTQCHELDEIEQFPLSSTAEVIELLGRMVENGLEAEEADLEQIVTYINRTYVGR
jgi:hypothetical protein